MIKKLMAGVIALLVGFGVLFGWGVWTMMGIERHEDW